MNKITTIIGQEYRNRVAKKSFILLTFLMPLLLAATIFVPLWLASINDNKKCLVTVIDQTGLYSDFIESLTTEQYIFDVTDNSRPQPSTNEYETSGASDDITNMMTMVIDSDLVTNPSAIAIYSDKHVPNDIHRYIETNLSDHIEKIKLHSYNIANIEDILANAKTDIQIATYKTGKDGKESASNTDIASIIGIVATMLIYMFIFISGSQVMSAVIEEKTNRIVEVMVCTVKPWQLMWGKIMAVALTCLTQILLWAVMTIALVAIGTAATGIDMAGLSSGDMTEINGMPAIDSSMAPTIQAIMAIDWTYIIGMFILYFIGGYLLYASLFAAIGAAVDNQNDTNQFIMPVTIIVLFALYAGIYSAENPDGPLAFWCSMIPFTSPIVMMVRLPFEVPVWELILSLGILFVTTMVSIWLSGKIYRVGILMYGKKPSWKELMKWIKY